MEIEELKKEINKLNWFHKIDFGNGIVTPGVDDSPAKAKAIGFPEDLHGISVLDIGAWDGFFSFEAEKRGASKVVAIDGYIWKDLGKGVWGNQRGKAGFDLAKNVLGSQVESRILDVYDISPEIGVFDLVLFLGVLYHLKHPLLALEKISSVTQKKLILETHVDLLDIARPSMVFYPGTELNNDTTNWWGPNPAAVISMLEVVGFKEVKIISIDNNSKRMICHAWK
jgi:tRNA (mo5U34)-methyltransferase